MSRQRNIVFSAPGKIHLLGEHTVVYGKPALLATVDLRVKVSVSQHGPAVNYSLEKRMQKVIEPIVKKYLRLKTLPQYFLSISSQIPIGSGLGSSAAISASYIAALLTYLRVRLDLNLVNSLTFQAEKVFHGNPSGADNSTVIYGGLIWYRKETDNLKLIQPLKIKSPHLKNFVLINTGTPKETTKEMLETVKPKVMKILSSQEMLTKELLETIQQKNKDELIRIIQQGQANLEKIGACSASVKNIIRDIESSGGAAKICGGGGKTGPTGVLLCFHPFPKILEQIAKSYNLDYFKTALGVEGLKRI